MNGVRSVASVVLVAAILLISGFVGLDAVQQALSQYHDAEHTFQVASGQGQSTDNRELLRTWLGRLLGAIQAEPESPHRLEALREVIAIFHGLNRYSESIPYHQQLIDGAQQPWQRAFEMYQMGQALWYAAITDDRSFARQAVAQFEALREYLEASGQTSIPGTQRLMPETMILQAQMHALLDEHGLAAKMYLRAEEWLPRLSEQDTSDLQGQAGPGGEFVLWQAAQAFAKCGESEKALPLLARLSSIPDRVQPLSGLWSRLLELDMSVFFDPALAWVRSLPDRKDQPANTIGRLASEAKQRRHDDALAYELLMLQLDQYADELDPSYADTLRRQQEFWRRDMMGDMAEPTQPAHQAGKRATPTTNPVSPSSRPVKTAIVPGAGENPSGRTTTRPPTSQSQAPPPAAKAVPKLQTDSAPLRKRPGTTDKPPTTRSRPARPTTATATPNETTRPAEPRAVGIDAWQYAGGALVLAAVIGGVVLWRFKVR